MKVWELEEGKVYKLINDDKFKVRMNEGRFEYFNGSNNKWEYSNIGLNSAIDCTFKEVVDTNSHWKPEEGESYFATESLWNRYKFHLDDEKKVECLALETKIKSVLLNWRRLHDNMELDWEYSNLKHYLTFNGKKVSYIGYPYNIFAGFGVFSSEEKAQRFYEYMKEDIDRYFEMRKELKF